MDFTSVDGVLHIHLDNFFILGIACLCYFLGRWIKSEIKLLQADESVFRELIMVKIRANASQRTEVISVADIFRAKIVDVEKESLMVELTGNQSKLEAFLELLDGYEILELARTGITGLSRGSKNVTYLD